MDALIYFKHLTQNQSNKHNDSLLIGELTEQSIVVAALGHSLPRIGQTANFGAHS